MDELVMLTERLAALEDQPVTEHPAVLESVHAALVAELDRLAGKTGAVPDPHRAAAP